MPESHLKLVTNNEPEDIERVKLDALDVAVECSKCNWRWILKMRQCIGDVKCPKCAGVVL